MKFNRRGFFGIMGSAVVAGPDSVKKAAEMSLKDLSVEGVGDAMFDRGYAPVAADGQTNWAIKELAKLRSMSKKENMQKKKTTYVGALDVNVATLRSVSIVHKYRMSKELVYKRNQENQETYLEGIIKGWWS